MPSTTISSTTWLKYHLAALELDLAYSQGVDAAVTYTLGLLRTLHSSMELSRCLRTLQESACRSMVSKPERILPAVTFFTLVTRALPPLSPLREEGSHRLLLRRQNRSVH